jgi:hypothetical protein
MRYRQNSKKEEKKKGIGVINKEMKREKRKNRNGK